MRNFNVLFKLILKTGFILKRWKFNTWPESELLEFSESAMGIKGFFPTRFDNFQSFSVWFPLRKIAGRGTRESKRCDGSYF